MSEWKPIETAPRDGTQIQLAQFLNRLNAAPIPVFTCIGRYWRFGEQGFYREGAGEFEHPLPATHWMPIGADNDH